MNKFCIECLVGTQAVRSLKVSQGPTARDWSGWFHSLATKIGGSLMFRLFPAGTHFLDTYIAKAITIFNPISECLHYGHVHTDRVWHWTLGHMYLFFTFVAMKVKVFFFYFQSDFKFYLLEIEIIVMLKFVFKFCLSPCIVLLYYMWLKQAYELFAK